MILVKSVVQQDLSNVSKVGKATIYKLQFLEVPINTNQELFDFITPYQITKLTIHSVGHSSCDAPLIQIILSFNILKPRQEGVKGFRHYCLIPLQREHCPNCSQNLF